MNAIVENTDILTIILHNDLDQHIAMRIIDQTKYCNFVLSWFCDTISCFVVLVTLNRHVIEDVKYMDGDTILLQNPFSQIFTLLK